jgi:hypothetical protein
MKEPYLKETEQQEPALLKTESSEIVTSGHLTTQKEQGSLQPITGWKEQEHNDITRQSEAIRCLNILKLLTEDGLLLQIIGIKTDHRLKPGPTCLTEKYADRMEIQQL